MGCVGVRNPAGGILSLTTLCSPSPSSSCATANVWKCSLIPSGGRISSVLDHSSSFSSSSLALDLMPVLLRASQSRFCSSLGSCSGRSVVEQISSCSSSGLRSDFVFNELSTRLIRAANSRLGQQNLKRKRSFQVHAKGPNDNDPPPVYSSDTKIRSEVISPFRSLRMFFYVAFIASGTIGSLITLTRFAAALSGAPNAQPISDIFKDLGIDLAAVTIFALLYRSDAKARDVSLAKISREEILSTLRVELANKKVVTLQQLRGIARIVIISGSGEFIKDAFQRAEPFKEDLLERGVLVVSYSLDGALPSSEPTSSTTQQGAGSVAVQEQPKVAATERWTATPIYTSEWSRWLNAQKKLANVSKDKPVYISLRLDGRVRGSGVGYPPWERFAVQLPPMTGMWKGPLDGMDGRI
ncbi:unnamed protein product [Calypogeia fissa]